MKRSPRLRTIFASFNSGSLWIVAIAGRGRPGVWLVLNNYKGLKVRILEELPLDQDGTPVMRIGGADLCDLLGISPAMLAELKKRGIAVHYRRDAYDLAKTVNAYVTHLRDTASGRGGEEHVTSLTAERARLARGQADAQAIKNAKLRGELIEAAAVERQWSDILRQVRARILAVSPRLRQVLDLDAHQANIVDREVRDALSELGNAGD